MTHSDVTDPTLRAMYAKELLTIRRVAWNLNLTRRDIWISGIINGVDTVFRRMQLYLCSNITLYDYLSIPIVKRSTLCGLPWKYSRGKKAEEA